MALRWGPEIKKFNMRAVGLPLILLLVFASAPAAQSVDEGVLALYDRAQRSYFDLKADAERSGDAEAWLGVVAAYRLIIDSYPNDPLVDDIIFITGGVYREMYEHFGTRSFLDTAVARYRTVLRDFPSSYLQQAALFAIGEIQDELMLQPEQALVTYNELVRRFPRGYKTAAARERIRELSGETREQAESEPAEEGEAEVAEADANPTSEEPGDEPPPEAESEPEAGESERRGPATIRDIRTSFGRNNGRVVIELSDEVEFTYRQLPAPNRRVYFDLEGVNLASSNLRTTDIAVENRYLSRIRIGQFSRSATRVVLDFDSFRRYRVFTLPSPFRIVFDLYGVGRGPGYYSAARAEAGAEEPAEATGEPSDGADSNHNGEFSISRQLGARVRTIVIDPGHGGRDPGAVGVGGLTEKAVALDVARRLQTLIEQEMPEIAVRLTRERDEFVELEQRTAIANSAEADLFFSIHANASRRRGSISGAETYFMNFATDREAAELAAAENAYSEFNQSRLDDLLHRITLNNKKEESRELARFIQTHLYRRTRAVNSNARNLGVKSAPFVVLIGADVPSVLVEVGFIDHPIEGRLMNTSDYLDRIAHGLLDGIRAYVESLE